MNNPVVVKDGIVAAMSVKLPKAVSGKDILAAMLKMEPGNDDLVLTTSDAGFSLGGFSFYRPDEYAVLVVSNGQRTPWISAKAMYAEIVLQHCNWEGMHDGMGYPDIAARAMSTVMAKRSQLIALLSA